MAVRSMRGKPRLDKDDVYPMTILLQGEDLGPQHEWHVGRVYGAVIPSYAIREIQANFFAEAVEVLKMRYVRDQHRLRPRKQIQDMCAWVFSDENQNDAFSFKSCAESVHGVNGELIRATFANFIKQELDSANRETHKCLIDNRMPVFVKVLEYLDLDESFSSLDWIEISAETLAS